MAKPTHCPRPHTQVVFKPRPGELQWYVRNARQMKLKPLKSGDKGYVVGESSDNRYERRKTVVVLGVRTRRHHEIDCRDLRVAPRKR